MWRKLLLTVGLTAVCLFGHGRPALATWPFGPVYKQRTVIRPGHHGGFAGSPVFVGTAPRGAAVLGTESVFLSSVPRFATTLGTETILLDAGGSRRETVLVVPPALTGLREESFRVVTGGDSTSGGTERNLNPLSGGTGGTTQPNTTPTNTATLSNACCDDLKSRVSAVEGKLTTLEASVKALDARVQTFTDAQQRAAAEVQQRQFEANLAQLVTAAVKQQVDPISTTQGQHAQLLNDILGRLKAQEAVARGQNAVFLKLGELLNVPAGQPGDAVRAAKLAEYNAAIQQLPR